MDGMMEYKYFKPFKPTDVKIKELADRLMNDYLYLPDEFRDFKIIHKLLFNGFGNEELNTFWEIGEFDGILGFVNILKGHKAGVVFKLWNKELWGIGFVKEIKKLIKSIMEECNLKRVETETPDLKMVKAAKLCQFRVEGRFKNAFVWEKKMYTLHKMRILREEI